MKLVIIFKYQFCISIPEDHLGHSNNFNCNILYVCSFEPVHEISINVVCATSKASDQPAHMRSLIRVFVSRLSYEYSLIVKLLTEHHLEFLSLTEAGPSLQLSNCWTSHATAQITCFKYTHQDDNLHNQSLGLLCAIFMERNTI